MWDSWGVICLSWNCSSVDWGSIGSRDVVWGSLCGGGDCPSGTPWNGRDVDGSTVVWGTAEGDTVVWGTTDGDTVVWGTTDGDTVVWGTSYSDPSCEPVIWPSP